MSVSTQEWFTVGHVKSAHGIRGEIFVVIPSHEWPWASLLESFQLIHKSKSDERVFEVETLRPHKNGLIISSPSIADRNQAEELRGYSFQINKQFLTSKPGEFLYLHEILGFKVSDQEHGLLGEVVGFSSHSLQDLIEVEGPFGRFDIPLVEQFIKSLDFDGKSIEMQLPQGLVPIDD